MPNKFELRPRRIFSDAVKREAVRAIESGKISVLSLAKQYGVCFQSVYGWINKYSRHLQSGQTMVVQMDSESTKNQELQKQIKELEAALGRKQMEVDFLNKLLETGKQELGIDLKKKFSTPPSNGSETTEPNTPTT